MHQTRLAENKDVHLQGIKQQYLISNDLTITTFQGDAIEHDVYTHNILNITVAWPHLQTSLEQVSCREESTLPLHCTRSLWGPLLHIHQNTKYSSGSTCHCMWRVIGLYRNVLYLQSTCTYKKQSCMYVNTSSTYTWTRMVPDTIIDLHMSI